MVVKSTEWRRNNRKRAAEIDRRSRLNRYGLTVEDFAQMVEDQNDACAICLNNEELVVDHDHDTNEVRGLLCRTCNRGIGLMRDDPITLQRAADYLFCKKVA